MKKRKNIPHQADPGAADMGHSRKSDRLIS